jgi:ADP-dependent NAD(P)H-hydrate dehydratase
MLPPRSSQAHKGSFGHILILGGSESMPGAPALAGLAALRSGAGLVTIATSREAHPITAGFSPALMTTPLPSQGGQIATTSGYLAPLLERADCLAVGPGLGQSEPLQRLCSELYREFPGPMVVDADGLNNLARTEIEWSEHAGPRILTPHLGEFRRICPQEASVLSVHPHDSPPAEQVAANFALSSQVVLLLKGAATLITDGKQLVYNTTGNSGLATAGSGDVLTGIISALWAAWRKLSALPANDDSPLAGQGSGTNSQANSSNDGLAAAVSGAHLHGLAADLAAAEISQTSLISSDLPNYLGRAIRKMGGV